MIAMFWMLPFLLAGLVIGILILWQGFAFLKWIYTKAREDKYHD